MVRPAVRYRFAQSSWDFVGAVILGGQPVCGHGTIKNHIGMGRAGHNAQVMDIRLRRNLGQLFFQEFPQLVDMRVIRHNRVKVEVYKVAAATVFAFACF